MFATWCSFDTMAPAQKLKAQTKYMLQQHTTRVRFTWSHTLTTNPYTWFLSNLLRDVTMVKHTASPRKLNTSGSRYPGCITYNY